jgi:hypothetical protein
MLVAIVAAACSTTGEDGADRPDDSTSAIVGDVPPEGDDLFLGIETDTTIITTAGYGALTAIDLDTGHARIWDDLSGVPGDHEFRLVPLDDGVAYPGSGGPLVVPWSLDAPPRTLGPAWIFLPGGEPDRVWLVPSLVVPDGAPPVAVEVDGEGDRTGREVTVGPDAYPIGALGDQLVLQGPNDPEAQGAPHTSLEPSGHPVPVDVPAATLAAGDDLLALAVGEQVVVLDDGYGDTAGNRTIELPGANTYGTAGAFSADGRRLAIAAGTESEAASVHLVLVDLATGEQDDIGLGDGPGFGSVTWSADDAWVFVLWRPLGPGGEASIVAHQPATGRTVEHEVPGLQAGAMITVPPGVGPDMAEAGEVDACPDDGGLDHNGNPLPAVTTGEPCRMGRTDVRSLTPVVARRGVGASSGRKAHWGGPR